MITVIAMILLAVYVANVVYVMRKGSLSLGLLFMAIVWTIVPFIGFRVVTDPAFLQANEELTSMNFVGIVAKVFQAGPEGWGSVLMNYLFGAFFGCVMVRTNITSTIIRKTVELGGDKPSVTVILLSIVLCLISTGVYGTGTMIALGVIVIPIMLALGISRVLAVITFVFSCVAGLWLNPALQNIYINFFSGVQGFEEYNFQKNMTTGAIGLVVTLVCTIAGVLLMMKREKRTVAWAAVADAGPEGKDAPMAALITPVVPAILVMVFQVPAFAAYLVSALYAFLICGRLKNLTVMTREFTESFSDGMVDTAPMLFFLVTISIFNATVSLAQPYLAAVIGPVVPQNTLGVAVIVAALAFLGLFRGPLTLGGSGIATLAILGSVGFRIEFLFPVLMATTMISHFCCCVTQSWTAWAISYAKADPQEYLKRAFLPLGWIIVAVLIAIAWIRVG